MSFEIALSGINAINTSLDSISNNIANSGTFGFKSTRANFSSMYAGTQPAGAEIGSLTQTIDVGGNGVLSTGRGLDATIQGRGFFVAKDTTGVEVYTRVGMFNTDQSGFLVDGSNRRVQGYATVLDASGVPVLGAGLGAFGDIQVPSGQVPAQATTKIPYVTNLSSDWTTPTMTTFDPNEAQSFSGSDVSVVYDSLGSKHTLRQYFVKQATPANTVQVNYTFDGATLGTPQTLTFGTDGRLSSPGIVALGSVTPLGASALAMSFDYTGTTQFAGESRPSVNEPNGYASGTRVNVQLAEDGSVMAEYSNGLKQKVGTLAIATFPNEMALTAINDTSWTTSNDSGSALYTTPGTGTAGDLTVGSIEQSNVDMTSELVSLMTSQRNYQANTKVISTESDMMQALMQAV